MQRIVLFIMISWLSVASYGQISLSHSSYDKKSLRPKEENNDKLKESLKADSSLLFLPRIEARFTQPDSLCTLEGDSLWYSLSGRKHFRFFHTIKTGLVHFAHFNRKLILTGLGLNGQRKEIAPKSSLQAYRLCFSEGLLLESLNQQPYHSNFAFPEEEDKSVLPVFRLFGRDLDFDLDTGNNKLLSKLYNPYKTSFRRTLQDGFLFTICFK